MKKTLKNFAIALALPAVFGLAPAFGCGGAPGGGCGPAKYIDPFVGTLGNAHCFPNACVPFGLIQAGPATGTEE